MKRYNIIIKHPRRHKVHNLKFYRRFKCKIHNFLVLSLTYNHTFNKNNLPNFPHSDHYYIYNLVMTLKLYLILYIVGQRRNYNYLFVKRWLLVYQF